MTEDEAQIIARIVGTADGGCSVCVSDLVAQLNERFPQYRWTATNDEMPEEVPTWSDDPEDAMSPGLLVLVEPAELTDPGHKPLPVQ